MSSEANELNAWLAGKSGAVPDPEQEQAFLQAEITDADFDFTEGSISQDWPEGQYFAKIRGIRLATMGQAQTPGHMVMWECSAGTCAGLLKEDFLPKQGKATGKTMAFFAALGLFDLGAKRFLRNWSIGELIGRELVITIVNREWTNDKGRSTTMNQVDFGGYDPVDEFVRPGDDPFAEAGKLQRKGAAPASRGAAPPAITPPTAPPAVASAPTPPTSAGTPAWK